MSQNKTVLKFESSAPISIDILESVLRKRLRTFFWIIVLGTAVSMFSAFSFSPVLSPYQQLDQFSDLSQQINQKLGEEMKKAGLDPHSSTVQQQAPTNNQVNHLGNNDLQEKKYVYINGKYYEANENNMYMVDGVPTYYLEKSPTAAAKPSAQQQKTQPGTGTVSGQRTPATVGGSAGGPAPIGNPLEVYTAKGAKKLMDNLHKAKANLEERNRILQELAE